MYRDILVIGAGVLGLSSAYHLKRQNPDKNILVIDRFSGPGQGNTAKSAGIFLNLFSSKINYLLADSTIDWLFYLQKKLRHNLNLTKCGYLYLLSESTYMEFSEPIKKMLRMGIELKIFDKTELKKRIPVLITELGTDEKETMGLKPLDVGVMGVNCGSINTDALARSLEAEFLKLGGEVSYNTVATGLNIKPKTELGVNGEPFVWQDIGVSGAKTTIGEIKAGRTVVAAGVWSERLLDPIGFDSLMRPKKRVIFVFKDPRLKSLHEVKGFNDYNILPFTHIPEISVYMKFDISEGSLWLGCSDDFGRKYGLEDDPQPESGLYSRNMYHALVRYLPCFENIRPVNMWAGQRAINRYDAIPVVATTQGMIYIGATTGFGISKFDSLGRIVAALYANEKEVELFNGQRFKATNLGIETRNVEKETFKV